MPQFYQEVEVDAEIHISVEDFYEKMDKYDVNEMIDLITRDGYFVNRTNAKLDELRGATGEEFRNAIIKLANNYYQLTPTETDVIIALAKRF